MKAPQDYVSQQGYATLYTRDRDGVPNRVDAMLMLESVGLSLALPKSSAQVLVLNSTCEIRSDVTRAEFADMFHRLPSIWFKVWTPDGSDLLCNFEWNADWRCEFYVIGRVPSVGEALVQGLLSRFTRGAYDRREQMLIVDWQDRAEGTDWNDIWNAVATYDGEPLDVMGLSDRVAPQFARSLVAQAEKKLPGHRILTTAAATPSAGDSEAGG